MKKHLLSILILSLFAVLGLGSAEGDSTSTTPASSSAAAGSTSSSGAAPEQTKAEYVEQLGRELDGMKSFDGSKYRGSKEAVQLEIVLFGAWAEMVARSSRYNLDPDGRAKVEQLRRRISQTQVREFPRMRAAWTKLLRDALWENDVSVSSAGNGNRTLRLTGAIFASNGNIKPIQQNLHDMLKMLRFKRAEYRWYAGADEYTYFTIESPRDGEVLRITKEGFAPAN